VTRSIRRLPAALALGALAAGLLAACSAGQIAQTSQIVPAVPGAQGQITVKAPDQVIFVRNATLEYPGTKGYAQGGAAPLSVWIVNQTQQAVTLTGVATGAGQVRPEPGLNSASPCSVPRSPEAPPVPSTTASGGAINSLQPSAVSTTGTTKATPSSTARQSPSGSPSPSAAASSATPPPTPTTAGSAGSATIKVQIPAGGCVALNRQSAQFLQIVDLARPVSNGNTVPVTFTFVGADRQTYQTGQLNVPVDVPATANVRTSPPAS
jgi:hypothetical protein